MAVPLFDMQAGAWTITGPDSSCVLELASSANANEGAVVWSERCDALPTPAVHWTLESAGLALWSREGERIAIFRTDMPPPLIGEDAAGGGLMLNPH